MFQNLRQGSVLYVLEKSEKPVLKMGEVVSVGAPTPMYNTQTAGLTMGFQPTMEVVVRAKVDGKEGDFPHLPATNGVHDYGNMVVTDSREAMLGEVDTLKRTAENVLASVERNENVVSECDTILKSLNPDYAKAKERDEAISNLNNRLDGIESTMSQVLKLLNKK